ncbi:uncharacterized protein FOMMEDRAFT_110262 [Fomitiporia mediterranea MF3/22]|uniref:uncharacterized protein n=1 Tax=Fomitiporia mediterranea (strain MF3/22) TaxID=694068 RepID=UPI0004409030|nr:uncharacterized protein FOMMEDRAFT_110262 [Fomitiporia mediterranea MF3/22]EJD00880.1 hypothetical protein FOMMEDRAFT_110262 [Fomitiporia mediterranea MF3/22]
MRATSLFGFTLLYVLPFAAAHGYVRSLTIDGKKFKGNVPNGATNPSVIRQVNSVEPVKGATNKALNCGPSAKKASLLADANPGSTLEFDWAGGDGSNWPHNIGPMMTYLASCGDTTCDKFDGSDAKWFKIDEVGLKGDSGSTWFQQDLMNGKTAKVKLPNNLASGQYLVRHEIIGLHIAEKEGGAEFYPSCAQLNVGGNGSGKPSSSELVSLPGAYKDTDPGILFNAFDGNKKYTFPVPKVAALVGGDSNTDSGSGSDNSDDNSTRANNVATNTASGDDGALPTASTEDSSPSSSSSGKNGGGSGKGNGKGCGDDSDDSGYGSEPKSKSSTESQTVSASVTATPAPTPTLSSNVDGQSGQNGSVLTSFATTSTIVLDSIPTDAVSESPKLRPRRVSRVMRHLLARSYH